MEPNTPKRLPISYVTLVVDQDLRILAEKVRGHIYLPWIDSNEVPHFGSKMCESFHKGLKDLTGTSFDLAFLYSTINETHHRHIPPKFIAIFESQQPVELVDKHLFWLDVREIRPETFQETEDAQSAPYARRVLEECSEKGVRPWEKPGWLQATDKLATGILAGLGYNAVSSFEQFHVNSGSAVLRAQTDKGRVYLKASSKREGKITECIAEIEPKVARKPLFVDTERGWMLMEDYGATLEDKMSLNDFEKLKDLVAGLQMKASKHLRMLSKCDVPRADADDILQRTEKMLKSAFMTEGESKTKQGDDNSGMFQDVDENSIRRYCASVGVLLKYLLEDHENLLTLQHGDLSDFNIIKCGLEEDSYVIFDWEHASIDIPFTDLKCIPTDIVSGEGRSRANIDSYLRHWAEYGSLDELKELMRCSELKQSLINSLQHYEYAVEKDLRPYLEEPNFVGLCETLTSITTTVAGLTRPSP